MSDYFLLCALPPEAAAVRAALLVHDSRRRRTTLAGRPQAQVRVGDGRPGGRVHMMGMGLRRAGKAYERLAETLPDGAPVVLLGVGGALVHGLAAGDLVVADAIGSAEVLPGTDELSVTSAPRQLGHPSEALAAALAAALRARFESTRRAPILSTGRIARGAELANLAGSGAVVCDTESGALIQLAERHPFAVVRAVVDSPDRPLVSLHTIGGGLRALKRLGDAVGIIAGVLEAESDTAPAWSVPLRRSISTPQPTSPAQAMSTTPS